MSKPIPYPTLASILADECEAMKYADISKVSSHHGWIAANQGIEHAFIQFADRIAPVIIDEWSRWMGNSDYTIDMEGRYRSVESGEIVPFTEVYSAFLSFYNTHHKQIING